jgi:maltose O-acetyltransferase
VLSNLVDFGASALFRFIACRLPASGSRGGRCWKFIRVFLASRMLNSQGSHTNIERGAAFGRRKVVSLGNRSGIGIDCRLYGVVEIGDDVMMGPEVIIYAISHEYTETSRPMISQGAGEARPVVIGNDVWIGSRAIILPGVRIGRGSIIGAGCVLARSVPEYSVVVGNPGRVIKSRLGQSRSPGAGPLCGRSSHGTDRQ